MIINYAKNNLECLVIGFEGDWGSGKTSMYNVGDYVNSTNKKSVIICGRNLEDRRRIENFLSPGYYIMGITDVAGKIDIFEDEPQFYVLDDLQSLKFDYIVISSLVDAVAEKWKNILVEKGISKDKIINPVVLKPNSSEKKHENMVKAIRDVDDDSFNGLIFGLSYSRKGIDRTKLSGKWFDFSSDGMDLYYNLQLLKYSLKLGKFPHVKEAILVAPNYYFQFDQSRSYNQFQSGQIFAVHELNDYHNFQKTGKYYPLIRNLIINYQMFGKKISEYYHVHRATNLTKVWDGKDGEGVLPGGWIKLHENTVPENLLIFQEFVSLLSKRFVNLTVIHPPLYIKGIVSEQRELLLEKNKEFWRMINENTSQVGVKIKGVDFTSVFAERKELFRDLEHLNIKGATEWGKIINKIIFKM